MTEEEKATIRQIHFYCSSLRETAQLVFVRNDCSDLRLVLEELKALHEICIENNS